jgi:phosphopantothenoylcysteine synthetase/decarboxylase
VATNNSTFGGAHVPSSTTPSRTHFVTNETFQINGTEGAPTKKEEDPDCNSKCNSSGAEVNLVKVLDNMNESFWVDPLINNLKKVTPG